MTPCGEVDHFWPEVRRLRSTGNGGTWHCLGRLLRSLLDLSSSAVLSDKPGLGMRDVVAQILCRGSARFGMLQVVRPGMVQPGHDRSHGVPEPIVTGVDTSATA